MQYRPQEAIPIVYLISDPNDSATYYVRSVMRNSGTGAIIKINGLNYKNLTVTAGNSRRFTGIVQAPSADAGGLHIDITTTVYTDSGYTTIATGYQESLDLHLIQERWNTGYGTGAGGYTPKAPELDWAKMEALIIKVFNELPSTDIPETDLSGVYAQGDRIHEAIKAITIPEQKPIDLSEHTNKILSAVADHFTALKIPELDLSPVLDQIAALEFPETASPSDVQTALEKSVGPLHEVLKELKELLPQQKYSTFMDDLGHALVHGKGSKNKPDNARLHALLHD